MAGIRPISADAPAGHFRWCPSGPEGEYHLVWWEPNRKSGRRDVARLVGGPDDAGRYLRAGLVSRENHDECMAAVMS